MKRYKVIEAPHSIDHRQPDIIGSVEAFRKAIKLGDRIAIYEWDGKRKHWNLIVDRTIPDFARLPKIVHIQNWLNVVQLRRACNIEVGTGKPGYRWAQGWIYTTQSGAESVPARLNEARAMAREEFACCRIVLE